MLRFLRLWFKKSLFFYPSKHVPDLLEYYVIVCGKLVYSYEGNNNNNGSNLNYMAH